MAHSRRSAPPGWSCLARFALTVVAFELALLVLYFLASFVTGIWAGSVTLMSTVYAYSNDLSTLAFLVSVALLYWRPGFPTVECGLGGAVAADESGTVPDGEE